MLSHAQVWQGIDRLAIRNDLSASGLARKAGLDPTTFNKSKRVTKDNKLRWPSTESLAKILEATNTSIADFVRLIENSGVQNDHAPSSRLKLISVPELANNESTDSSGFLICDGLDEINANLVDSEDCFAIELDEHVAPPLYLKGDLLVVSPTSGIRRDDRVILKTQAGQIMFATMIRKTANSVSVIYFSEPGKEHSINIQDIAWMVRIIWVSQ